jgi:hypothetical protein
MFVLRKLACPNVGFVQNYMFKPMFEWICQKMFLLFKRQAPLQNKKRSTTRVSPYPDADNISPAKISRVKQEQLLADLLEFFPMTDERVEILARGCGTGSPSIVNVSVSMWLSRSISSAASRHMRVMPVGSAITSYRRRSTRSVMASP